MVFLLGYLIAKLLKYVKIIQHVDFIRGTFKIKKDLELASK